MSFRATFPDNALNLSTASIHFPSCFAHIFCFSKMAASTTDAVVTETDGKISENTVKIICLGDSAVGKSKLMERFLMDGYQPQQLSTYALTLYRYNTKVGGNEVVVDFWDTAGQERFSSMHPSYYHQAHACIMVFDVTRKVTYKNLPQWYEELRTYRPEIPCLLAANKIDVDYNITQKNFNFVKKYKLPFYFVSAADGTNVVKLFREAIKSAAAYKANPTDFTDEVMRELENFDDLTLSSHSGQDTANHSEDKEEEKETSPPSTPEGASGSS